MRLTAIETGIERKAWLMVSIFTTALLLAGCAAFQPPSATGPRESPTLYPVLFAEDIHRRESTAVALSRLAAQTGNASAPQAQLQPVTATIQNLSPAANSALYLPKVGAAAVMSEEEVRESLRRFIKEWPELIGADPSKLSLVDRIDQPDGSKVAIYEQRPFRYPIRGNYGKLQIHFTADRRVLNVTSSCIPDAERIQTSLSALTVRFKAEEAVQQLRAKGLAIDTVANANLTLPASSQITPRGLVTYIRPQKDRPDALEIHLAWEMELTSAPVKTAYVDAITGDVIATE